MRSHAFSESHSELSSTSPVELSARLRTRNVLRDVRALLSPSTVAISVDSTLLSKRVEWAISDIDAEAIGQRPSNVAGTLV